MAKKLLPPEVEDSLRAAYDAGVSAREAWQAHESQGVTERQVQLRWAKFADEDEMVPAEEMALEDGITALLQDRSLGSQEKILVAIMLMQSHLGRVHAAASNPRKVKIDLRAERLLSESLERFLKALKENPYESE